MDKAEHDPKWNLNTILLACLISVNGWSLWQTHVTAVEVAGFVAASMPRAEVETKLAAIQVQISEIRVVQTRLDVFLSQLRAESKWSHDPMKQGGDQQ